MKHVDPEGTLELAKIMCLYLKHFHVLADASVLLPNARA